MKLAGKVALITGAGQGIGRATALAFAREGADIVVDDMNFDTARRVAEEVQTLGRDALGIKANVASPYEVEYLIAAAREKFKKIDILVNNAAIITMIPFLKMSRNEWEQILDIDLHGIFHCTRAVIEQMMEQKWGRVISLSSCAGQMGMAGAVHYSTAKAGILGFTKALAREVAPLGITVNAIAPGGIDTAQARSHRPGLIEEFIEATPVGRIGRPEEVASLCLFLASEEASFITGQVISPNGGLYM